jgi:hypothetical protein
MGARLDSKSAGLIFSPGYLQGFWDLSANQPVLKIDVDNRTPILSAIPGRVNNWIKSLTVNLLSERPAFPALFLT